jgi:Kef-type K+ transport system membrane component KefB
MFVVGVELGVRLLRQSTHIAILISQVSVIVPFSWSFWRLYIFTLLKWEHHRNIGISSFIVLTKDENTNAGLV